MSCGRDAVIRWHAGETHVDEYDCRESHDCVDDGDSQCDVACFVGLEDVLQDRCGVVEHCVDA